MAIDIINENGTVMVQTTTEQVQKFSLSWYLKMKQQRIDDLTARLQSEQSELDLLNQKLSQKNGI